MKSSIGLFLFGEDETIPEKIQEELVSIGLIDRPKPADDNLSKDAPDFLQTLSYYLNEVETIVAIFPEEYKMDQELDECARKFSFQAAQSVEKRLIVVKEPEVGLPLDFDIFPTIVFDSNNNWRGELRRELR